MSEEAESGRLRLLLRAFKHRNYRLFFGGQIVSLVGSFLTATAMSWLVLRLTNDPLLLGVVGFAGQVPMFFLAPLAGVWIDRWDRRRLIVITQVLAMVQSLALAYLAFTHVTFQQLVALAVFQGMISAFDMPARQAFLVEMVPDRADLPNAIALNSTMVHAARLLGPAAAGVMIALTGEAMCFLIDGLSYIGVIVALLMMRVPPRARPAPRGALHELLEGLRYAWGFAPIRVLLLAASVVSLTGMPALSVLLPIYGRHFGGAEHGSTAFGFLAAASGAGALVGALALATRRSVVGLGKVIALALLVFAAALLAVAWSRWFWVTLLVVPVAGWGMITTFASTNTLLQTVADDDKRGRVMSLFTMAFAGMTPFGILVAGALTKQLGTGGADDLVGPSRTLVLAAASCLAAAGWFLWLLPRMRRLVHPVYVRKGILPEMSVGLQQASPDGIGPPSAPTAG